MIRFKFNVFLEIPWADLTIDEMDSSYIVECGGIDRPINWMIFVFRGKFVKDSLKMSLAFPLTEKFMIQLCWKFVEIITFVWSALHSNSTKINWFELFGNT